MLPVLGGANNRRAISVGLSGLADPPASSDISYLWIDQSNGHAYVWSYLSNGWMDLGQSDQAHINLWTQQYNLAGYKTFGGMLGGGGVGGGNPTNGSSSPSDPCPCEWKTQDTLMFLSDTPIPGGLPVSVTKEQWVCDQPANVHTKINCDKTNAALSNSSNIPVTGGDNNAVNGLSGFGGLRRIVPLASALDNVGVDGGVTIGTTPQSGMADWMKYALAAAGGIVVGHFALKHV